MAPELADPQKQAIRVGGRLTCVSAATALGLRVLHTPDRLHVEVAEHDSRFRRPHDAKLRLRPRVQLAEKHPQVQFHWSSRPSTGSVMPSLVDVLAEALGCLPPLDALCILDSARESVPPFGSPPKLGDEEFERLLRGLSRREREIALRSSSLSQAVGETVARERLREAGIDARPQMELPGGYRCDLLIGDRLIVEVEGYEAHGDKESFRGDRARLAWLRACGYTVLNFSHDQVINDWPSVLSTVQLVMRRLQRGA